MDLGLLVTAALLGVTHAVEPDHVAGVVGLTGDASRARAALVGGAFAAGHAVLVVAWLAVVTLLVDDVPALADGVGDAVLGTVLILTAGLVAADAYRTLRDGGHRHPHVGPLLARADGGPGRLLAFGVVGALFTVSPPVAMLGFVSGVLPGAGATEVWIAVAVYTAVITAAMATVGAAGSIAVRWLGTRSDRYAAAGKAVAALTLAGLGVTALV